MGPLSFFASDVSAVAYEHVRPLVHALVQQNTVLMVVSEFLHNTFRGKNLMTTHHSLLDVSGKNKANVDADGAR
jgi:hypothetical protein